jgi:hypothetical protein
MHTSTRTQAAVTEYRTKLNEFRGEEGYHVQEQKVLAGLLQEVNALSSDLARCDRFQILY